MLQAVTDYMDRYTDPRIRHWKIVESSLLSPCIVVIYLLAVLVLLPSYMKNRKPYNLTTIIRFYNIFQVITCFSMIYMIADAGWWQGQYSWGCQAVDYSNDAYAVKLLNAFYWTYWLKMVEMIETVFFILRKKFDQVSALHVYHHVSTFLIVWLACKYVGGGITSVHVMVNCFVHIPMYSYYYLSSFGEQWQKKLSPWKPKLTMLQMIQLSILLFHSILSLQPSCRFPKLFFAVYIPNLFLNIKMFYDFYTKQYNRKHISKTNKSINKSHTK